MKFSAFHSFFRIHNSVSTPGMYRFSGSVSTGNVRFHGYGGHLDFISFTKSFLLSVKCLETLHIFGVCESIGIVHFHVRPKTRLWRPS